MTTQLCSLLAQLVLAYWCSPFLTEYLFGRKHSAHVSCTSVTITTSVLGFWVPNILHTNMQNAQATCIAVC